MIKKYLLFLVILTGYNCSNILNAAPVGSNAQERPIDLVAFWSGVANYYKNNPEFREHALTNLKRVQTLKEHEGVSGAKIAGTVGAGAGLVGMAKQYAGSPESWKEKAIALKNRYMPAKAKEPAKPITKKAEKTKSEHRIVEHHPMKTHHETKKHPKSTKHKNKESKKTKEKEKNK